MVRMRPALALVHCSRRWHPVHKFPKEALRWWCCPPGPDRATVCPAGQVTTAAVVSMAKSSRVKPPRTAGRSGGGEAPGGGGPEGGGLEEQPVPGLVGGLADIAAGVGGVAEGIEWGVLVGKQFQADRGLVVLGPGAGSEGDGGE